MGRFSGFYGFMFNYDNQDDIDKVVQLREDCKLLEQIAVTHLKRALDINKDDPDVADILLREASVMLLVCNGIEHIHGEDDPSK